MLLLLPFLWVLVVPVCFDTSHAQPPFRIHNTHSTRMEDSKAGRRSAAPTPTPSEGGRQQATSRQPSPRTTPTPAENLSIHVPPLAPVSPHYHRHHPHRHQGDDEQGWDSDDDEEQDDDETSIHRDHTREFPGLPPSFAALESQISDTRSRSDSLSSVSCSNFTRRPLSTPSISPATSTPHHGVGFSLAAAISAAVAARAVGVEEGST